MDVLTSMFLKAFVKGSGRFRIKGNESYSCDENKLHLNFFMFKEVQHAVATHHRPRSVGYLGVFLEALNDHLDEVVVVVVAFPKQHLADDVGGRVVKHHPGTHRRT